MQPGEELSLGVRRQPSRSGIGNLVGAALSALFSGNVLMKLFIERVEPLAESECRSHGIRADERRGFVTVMLEEHCEGRVAGAEREHDVASDAVHRRVYAGENRCMG